MVNDMAIRLTTERIVNAVLAFVLLLLAVLLATGCKTDVPVDVTGVDASKTATTTMTVPVSVGDLQGDLTVITLAGATPWAIAGLVGLLGLFQARRQSTATQMVDRMMEVIELSEVPDDSACRIKQLKKTIASRGGWKHRPDRVERFARSRLARWER